MNSRSLTVALLCAGEIIQIVASKGQRIEGDDIVRLNSDDDFFNDAIDQLGSPFYGGTQKSNKNRTWAQTIVNILVLLITLIIVGALLGGLGYLGYKMYKKY